jgi:7-keto-8-aminopelargonate synthetase-like enzyme
VSTLFAPPPLMESPPGAQVVIGGRSYLYFAGTSYFALHGHPEVIEAGVAALRRHGVHSATTRAGYGNIAPVLEVERRAAELFATDDAFYFPTGYASNHVLVQALAAEADTVFVEDSAHFCVAEAAKLSGLPCHFFRARDAAELAVQLRRQLPAGARPLVIGDAVVPPTGELAPVKDYLAVLSRFAPAILLLDDAHGFGVIGEHGRGTLEHCACWEQANGGEHADGITLAVGGTTSKALGGFGGIIPGSTGFLTRARRGSHWFDGASAPGAAAAGSTAKALELVARDSSFRLRVRANSARLRAGLRALGIEVSESPAAQAGVVVGDAANMRRLHTGLKERGVLVPYVDAYSGIGTEGLLRFAVCSAHTPEMIGQLLDTLRALL